MRRRWALGAVVVALLLVVPPAATGAVLAWQLQERADLAAGQAEDRAAVAAARHATLTWASVDHREAPSYVAAVEDIATGDFLEQFRRSEPALLELLRTSRSVQVPRVPDGGAGLVERRDDVASVVVALDATVTNASTRRPQPRQYRLLVSLQKVDGVWLTEDLELVP